MLPRSVASALVCGVSCTVLLTLADSTPAAAGAQKGKIVGKSGKKFDRDEARWVPEHWASPPWPGVGGGSRWGGVSGVGRFGSLGGGGGVPRVMGMMSSMPGMLGGMPGVSPFGGLGIPLGEELREWPFRREERLLFELLPGMFPEFGGLRDPMMRLMDPDFEVSELLRQAVAPSIHLRHPIPRVANPLLLLDDDLAPFGTGLRSRGGVLGFEGRFGTSLAGLDALATLDSINRLNRGWTFGPTFGTGPMRLSQSAQVLQLMQMIEGYGHGYGGMGGLGGFRGGMLFPDPVFPSFPGLYRDPFFMPGFPRRNVIDPWGRGPGWGRPMVMAPAPSRPRGPSAEEQRAAMDKFHKSLVAVEAMARVGAWDVLGEGLAKSLQTSGLPGEVSAPLKGLQTEANRITDLLKLRDAVTTVWKAAPDTAALTKQLESLRAATGDRDLTDRLTRLLAVKAAWEGHSASASALAPDRTSRDIDEELGELLKHRALAPVLVSFSTHDDRELACRRVVRGVVDEIDHHIGCGRYTAAAHVQDVQEMRRKAKELAGASSPKSAAGSFESAAEAVGKALGRTLTETDRVVLRKMHAAGKSVEAIVEALR